MNVVACELPFGSFKVYVMHEFGKKGGERDHDFPFAAFFCDLVYDRGRWQQVGPSNISIFEESSRRVLVSESVPRGSKEKSERELHFEKCTASGCGGLDEQREKTTHAPHCPQGVVIHCFATQPF